MDSEYQKELFEFDDKPRKQFPGLERMLPKADFEGKISVTLGLEKIIFISIGIVLCMVIVFALGVERGRSIEITAIERLEKRVTDTAISQNIPRVPAQAALTAQTGQPKAAIAVAAIKPPIHPAQKTPAMAEAEDIKARPFTIVAVTFSARGTAAQAQNWMKKEGHPAYLQQDDRYFLVCVGPYTNKSAAQAALVKVRRLYKDAYIKTRQ